MYGIKRSIWARYEKEMRQVSQIGLRGLFSGRLTPMKLIILAGGLGTRLSEETSVKPKPMVIVANQPIIWHIMEIYSLQGFNEFIIALGYKGDVIRDWISAIATHQIESEIPNVSTFQVIQNESPIKVHLVDTGDDTQTGGRIKRIIGLFSDKSYFATYGDGLANVNIKKLLEFHKSHGKICTVTAVHPPARFGHLDLQGDDVVHFGEKIQMNEGWINGGFFVVNSEIENHINSEIEPLEAGALPRLARLGQMKAFKHSGFWRGIDTLRDRNEIDVIARSHNKPWLVVNEQ